MILYALGFLVVLLIALITFTNEFNPVLQFNFITGLGFLFLYDEEYVEEGKQITFQLMLAVVLISITYVKNDAGDTI